MAGGSRRFNFSGLSMLRSSPPEAGAELLPVIIHHTDAGKLIAALLLSYLSLESSAHSFLSLQLFQAWSPPVSSTPHFVPERSAHIEQFRPRMVRPFPYLAHQIHSKSEAYGFMQFIAPPWSSDGRARPSHACRTQEWRDAERTPCQLRQLDELNTQGGCPDQPGRRSVLQAPRSVHQRKQRMTGPALNHRSSMKC